MTAPRWIAEAIAAASDGLTMGDSPGVEELATALIERLPLEALAVELDRERSADRDASLMAMVRVLTDGDPEVVELTELYQSACLALDEAGVPYASERVDSDEASATFGSKFSESLNLADRIRWLAQQRPTRLDLQRVEAERDDFRSDAIHARALAQEIGKRDAAIQALTLERDQLRTMSRAKKPAKAAAKAKTRPTRKARK